jgi:hypothetical protein
MSKIFTRLNLGDVAYSSGVKCFKRLSTEKIELEAGLYDANDIRLASWDTLTDTYGMDVEKAYSGQHKTDPSSPYYVMSNNDTLANGVTLVIGDGVSCIGDSALRDCANLKSVVIPHGVSVISYASFRDCTSLESVVMPDSVVNLIGVAFYNCSSLTDVKIPKNVTQINMSTFYNCSSLKSVTIGSKVTRIADHAFRDCSSLKDVYYTGTKEEWAAITIGSGNDALAAAIIHYNYVT